MGRWMGLLMALVVLLAVAAPVQAAAPDEPPGLNQANAAKDRHADALLSVQGVAGVAVGLGADGRGAVVVFTETPGLRGLPISLDGVAVVPQFSGKFASLPKKAPPAGGGLTPRDRWPRPVPIGVSTGHPAVTAGTIGARVKDAAGNIYALSNNHVYANENRALAGDMVLQPGTYDGGASPVDGIGTLSAFESIVFSDTANNVIDAAIALSSVDMLGKATPPNGYGVPKSGTTTALPNMKVKKYGRTTGMTKGQVYAINAIVKVQYDSGVARFTNQIIITPGGFSAGGDSGSLIVTDSRNRTDDRRPVGLLFAGSQTYTVANPIGPVLARFGITVDGE